jgi:hypothetical protein
MSSMVLQTVIWLAAGAVLLMFLARRRKRKAAR